MFTGIVEEVAEVVGHTKEGSNLRLAVQSNILKELKVDQSVAHNGVCLTVEKLNEDSYEVVAVKETLEKTNLDNLKVGDKVNIERCMKMNDRLDGHIVQGHVDELATVKNIDDQDGSWNINVQLNRPSKLIVEKGSVCLNGISLTAFNVNDQSFEVTIIPYTWENTMLHTLVEGDSLNIEFDIIGKYVARLNEG